jgi:hypothetical protein
VRLFLVQIGILRVFLFFTIRQPVPCQRRLPSFPFRLRSIKWVAVRGGGPGRHGFELVSAGFYPPHF